MQVQVNANHTVQTIDSMEQWATTQLNDTLARFRHDITSVDVHMSDENGDKISPDHKRCMMEARLPHHEPIVVSNTAQNVDEAFRGAADKLKRAIDHAVGKQRDHRDRESIRRGSDLAVDPAAL